ncbi:MAG: hypothetical protein JWO32_1658 [Bacteroidetes bacterium]|nr:hypothetical protein [Bacteroidota bacterium]
MNHGPVNGTLLCTLTGTALSLTAHIDSPELVKTILLATLGAVVSFNVSLVMKWIFNFLKKPSCPEDKQGGKNSSESDVRK